MIIFLKNRNKCSVYFFISQVIFTVICRSSEKNVRSPIPAAQHRVNKRQSSVNCTTYQFTCKSRDKCIDRALICDGVKDCVDSSDEIAELCKDIPCPGYAFQCDYGACIDSSAKCDGRTDCVDNSDETSIECPPLIADVASNVHCKTNQFQCMSGRCIEKNALCNGRRDCDDGSDETIRQCESFECPASSFKCRYGACINGRYRCDGVKHCPDGSDEFQELCRPVTEPPPTKAPPVTPQTPDSSAPGSCTLPTHSADKKFTVICPEKQKCSKQAGKKVPKFTEIAFQCNSGYVHEDGEFKSYCSSGNWVPPIANCSKICKKLKPRNVDLTCVYKGVTADCDGDLLAGTVVRPRCKSQHHEEFSVYYRDITCDSDGEWSDQLFVCVPDCGKPFANVTKLVYKGEKESYGDSPWHVAIYSLFEQGTPLICGGTIISSQLIVSAAHCFYDELNSKPYRTSDFEVAVSKVTRNYNSQDNPLMKKYRIRQIFFSDKGYFGPSTNFAADIVLLWVVEKITLSRAVLPACIQWTEHSFEPVEGTPGKVVGWGLTEKGEPSEILLAAQLPYISYKRCVEIADKDLKDIVTENKFCAGSKSGPGVLQGDSGGGLLFRDQNTGLYFLRGVVSVKASTNTSIAIFTDLTQYLDWMSSVRVQVENAILKEETSLKPKT